MQPSPTPAFSVQRNQFLAWFRTQAMPLWTTAGVDSALGGVPEKLDAQGRPVDEPRRTRVVARQLYVWAVAENLGWPHDTSDLIAHGLDFLLNRLLQPDGTFASSVTPQGQVVNAQFDLYEQAFALFAMATVYRRRPEAHAELLAVSSRLLAALRAGWGHPLGGFEESQPRTLPLRANPHMHLFEAALQWAEALQATQAAAAVQAPWWALADELAELALKHMVNAPSGLLTELFDGDWRPMPGPDGSLVEPGHQFEWGWCSSAAHGHLGRNPRRVPPARGGHQQHGHRLRLARSQRQAVAPNRAHQSLGHHGVTGIGYK